MTDTLSISRSSTCRICDAPLSWSQGRNHQLCSQAECVRRYLLLKKQNKLCRICHRPLSDRHWVIGICSAPDCQRTALTQCAQRQHQQRIQQEQRLWTQAQQLRDEIVARFGIRAPQSFRLAVIPAAIHRTTRLPAQRRRQFHDQLQSLIDRAAVLPMPQSVNKNSVAESVVVEEARLQAVLGQACACCQGSCCQGGAHTHAYLGVDTLQRYMVAHPDQQPRQVLTAYMRHIGKETCEDSCIYHRADGCSLPRDMRADICNEFYCGGLREFQANIPTTGSIRGLFVATTDDAMQRAALVHEGQSLMMTVPPMDAD